MIVLRCRYGMAGALMVAAVLGACGGNGPAQRPATAAKLTILEPSPNQVTGPDVKVRFDLSGARVVPASVVKGVRGDEGHLHVSVDGKLVSMAYGTSQDLPNLAPGPHSVSGEFVADDHRPFRNRVVAAVLFRVGP